MQNFSFFEIAEAQAPMVIKALNKTTANGRRVIVEVAGENNGKSDKSGKKQKNATAKPAEKKGKKEVRQTKAQPEPDPVGKNVATHLHGDQRKKTTGNSSSFTMIVH